MSSLIGTPGDRWTLARAIDAMGDSVRQVARPGLVWLCGLFFPGLTFMAGSGGELIFPLFFRGASGDVPGNTTAALIAGITLVVLGARITAGLARLGAPEAWTEHALGRRTVRLRDVWRAGSGLGWSALGLWLLVLTMLAIPALVVLAPPLYVLEHWGVMPGGLQEETNFFCAIILGPFASVVLVLGLVLSVTYQLALQSLVHNRRGTASALQHAWRLARHDPWATARAVVVDFLALVTIAVVYGIAVLLFAFSVALVCCLAPALFLLYFVRKPWTLRTVQILYGAFLMMLPGFIGVVRAAFWARVYRELGGLSPVDGVPGLHPKAPGSSSQTATT